MLLLVVKKINIFKLCTTFPNKKVNRRKFEKSFESLETPNAAPKTDISFIPSTVECVCVRACVCTRCACVCRFALLDHFDRAHFNVVFALQN